MPEPLPMLANEDYASLRRNTTGPEPTLTREAGEIRLALDTGRVRVDARYRPTAPSTEDGAPDESTRFMLAVSVDGRTVPTPARWSGVVALVREPDALLPEHITDDDTIRVEVSGDYAETWAPYIINPGSGDRDVSLMRGRMARTLIATRMNEHHGRYEYGPGSLVVQGTLFNESFSRHAWRFTRETAAEVEQIRAKETSK